MPAAAILPKYIRRGRAGWPIAIFDHAKIAIIDAMTRLGLPPVNPVFGEVGAAGQLTYYYLWHFSAAELALVAAHKGWEADIGLTWFTAFASLTLMMGLAVWLVKHPPRRSWSLRSPPPPHCAAWFSWMSGSHELTPVLLHADRLCRLAVSGHVGSSTFDVCVMRRDGDAACCPLRATARARLCF